MKRWYDFKCRSDNDYEVAIYDEIGGWGISANELCERIRTIPENAAVTVGINSPGGNVFDGIAIYNTLRARNDVTCRVDGIAASIASVILLGGDRRVAPEGSTVMVHDPSGMVFGTADDMDKTADVLRKIKKNIVDIYSGRTGLDEKRAAELMDDETWMNADEARELGFVTEVSTAFSAKAHDFDLSGFLHPPGGGNRAGAIAGVVPPPVENTRRQKHTMKTLLNALAEFDLVAKGVEEETEAVIQVRENLTARLEPLNQIPALESRVGELTAELKKVRAAADGSLIDSAVADGRIAAANKPKWVGLASENEDAFRMALDALPKSVTDSDKPVPPQATGTDIDIVEQYRALAPGEARNKFRVEHAAELTAAFSN